MGNVYFAVLSQGPVLPNPISVPSDLFKLNFKVDVKEPMKGTLQAIAETRILLQYRQVALIGFSGGKTIITLVKRWRNFQPNKLTMDFFFCSGRL